MFGMFSSKEGEELALVFDVGSSSVGGAIFSMTSSGIPKINSCLREPITLEESLDPGRLFELTLKSLDIVADKIAKGRAGAPKKIFCVLSSPWYMSQTRVIKRKSEVPFTFSSKLADELTQKEIKIFESEHKEKYSAGGAIRHIELRNIKTLLNGYETRTPLNQKASEIEMVIFVSLGSEEVLKKIENTINKHFVAKSVKFSSFAMASFTVTRDLFPKKDSFLLIDIAGEMTDISMVKKQVLRESVSFPVGRNFMIRGAASELSCSLHEAESCISLFKDGHAAEAEKMKIEPVINKLKTEWLKNFQESIANLSSDISIPATIYMAVDEDFADFFAQTIKTEQFSQYTLAESKFEVVFLGAPLLHGLAAFKEDVMRDSFIIICSIYINRFLNRI